MTVKPEPESGIPAIVRGVRITEHGVLGDVRTRAIAFFLILLAASTAASLLVLREVLMSRIDDEVDRELATQVESLRGLADSGVDSSLSGNLERTFNAFLDRERPPDAGFLTTFIDGRPFRSEPPAAPAEALRSFGTIKAPQDGHIQLPTGELRFVAVPVSTPESSGVLVAAKSLDHDRERVGEAVQIAAGVSIVIMLLASLFIWLAAGRTVAPLRELARMTRRITETDLSERLNVRGDGEIAHLGRTYNEMLDRLESAFADQAEFLADVGHELRTPITIIRGNLETLSNDPAERREAQAVIEDELQRMTRLVDDLLLLARSGRPDFLRVEPLDLDLFTHELFAKARKLGVRRWLVDGAEAGLIHADPHRLTSAVMNLAQNAVRHTRGDEAIALGSEISDGYAKLWVRDEGEGIQEQQHERIFERFAGTGASGAEAAGSGLGLAIVRAVAEAHGGYVELESEPSSGSRFTIVLPTSTGSAER